MKNLAFITGVVTDIQLDHEWNDKKFYKATVSVYKGDHEDFVLCLCGENYLDILKQSLDGSMNITIYGTIRSNRNPDDEDWVYVFAHDCMLSLPFSEDENTMLFDARIVASPRVYANRTVIWVKLDVNNNRFAFAPIVGYNATGRYMARFSEGDILQCEGYMIATQSNATCQIVIEKIEKKGETNENHRNHGEELQGNRRNRGFTPEHDNGFGREQGRKEYAGRHHQRYLNRKADGRQYARPHQTYGRAWE